MTPFGCYIEALRRSRGLQQQQLAAKLGVNSCYLSNIENGKKGPPSSKVISRLISELNLDEIEVNQLREKESQSKSRLKIPTGAGIHEYALVEQLWKRLGTLSVAEAEALSKVLQLGQNKRTDMMI